MLLEGENKMANLTDFLEPKLMPKMEVEVRARKDFKEWEDLRGVCESFLSQGIFAGGADKSLSQPEKEIVAREESIMLGIWKDQNFLPAEMANSVLGEVQNGEVAPYQRKVEPLVKFSALPQTQLKYIRNAAEKLSFAIVPYEYINRDGIVAKYAEEGQWRYSEMVQDGFKDVEELCTAVNVFEQIELYILCPVGFYDPWQEVQDAQARQKIFGGELSSIAMILGMLMPTQKNLFQMSKTNADNIEKLNRTMEANFTQVRETLDDIQGRISWLSEVAELARRAADNASRESHIALEKAQEVEYRLWCMLDPLIFAVPQGTDLKNDNVDARLLMCFGADMPLDFFLRRGLVQVNSNGCYDPIIRIYK